MRIASASNPTLNSGSINRFTSTIVEAGLISRKNSAWALPINVQSSILVIKIRVLTTFNKVAFTSFNDFSIFLIMNLACSDESPITTIFPFSSTEVVPDTNIMGPALTNLEYPTSDSHFVPEEIFSLIWIVFNTDTKRIWSVLDELKNELLN